MLERYLTIRQLYPQWFQKLDCEDPELMQLVESGYLVPLIQKDNGRTVLLSIIERFDPHKYISPNSFDQMYNSIKKFLYDFYL